MNPSATFRGTRPTSLPAAFKSDYLARIGLTPKLLTHSMDSLVEQLNSKLGQWEPLIAEQVRRYLLEIIELADQGIPLDLIRSRRVEQEVLDLLDEP